MSGPHRSWEELQTCDSVWKMVVALLTYLSAGLHIKAGLFFWGALTNMLARMNESQTSPWPKFFVPVGHIPKSSCLDLSASFL